MIYEPIIRAYEKRFAESFNFSKETDDVLFEKFVNYTELLQHQPDAFSSDFELMDLVSVGGSGDGGIDGLGIKVNGIFVKSIDEIDNFLKNDGRISIEFIFIQSKNKKQFENDKIAIFINGIRAFFDKSSQYPFNESVVFWRELKEYLYTEEVMLQWKDTPVVRCYYVTLGEVREHIEHEEQVRQFKKDMLEVCESLYFHFHGAKEFKLVIEQNQNKFKEKLPYIDTMTLPGSSDVGNSCLVICRASDYVSFINTGEGIIRKTLFNDNVRDFQGENTVNDEIYETLSNNPEKFVLFNNGITIVCASYKSENRILEIEDPQIVNGCQSSYILFNASKNQVDLDNVTVVVKIISTNSGELSNEIVRGTNRQNIVMEEAFEATKPFHKSFEKFVTDYVADFQDKIYYERRAKQYENNPSIRQYQKFSLKILTQYSVAALLQRPYQSHLHESYLLKSYKEDIFREGQSFLPYFTVVYSFYTLEKLIREGDIPKYFIKYKAHLLMIYFKLLGGKKIDLSNERAADKYVEPILSSLYTWETAKSNFNRCIDLFRKAEHYWVNTLHKNTHVMKEAQIFTELLIKIIDGIPLDSINQKVSKLSELKYGFVEKIIRHTGSKPYGFIRMDDGKSIFFSCIKNHYLNLNGLLHARVSFNVTLTDGKNRQQAINIRSVVYQ